MVKLLTVAAVQRLRPQGKRREVRDGGAPGLRLVIQPSGHKSWAMRMRRPDGRSCKVTLGPVDLSRDDSTEPVLGGPLSLGAARQLAARLSRQRAQGQDVAEQKRQLARQSEGINTFSALARDFIEGHARPHNRGWRATAKVLGLSYPADGDQPAVIQRGLTERWAAKPTSEIDASMIYSVVDEFRRHAIPGTRPKNRRLSDARGRAMAGALGKLFGWAVQHRRVATNPTVGMFRPKSPPSRDRLLGKSEIREFWQACSTLGWPFGPCLQLLLVTGARRSEVAGMQWAELNEDFSIWSLPSSRTKNKLPHVVFLPPMAREIIAKVPRVAVAAHVFTTNGSTPISGFSKIKLRLNALTPSGDWRFHDLRRTAVTNMAELGVLPHVIEAVVNHISGHKGGVAGVYNRAAYSEEKKAALELWADHLTAIVSGQPARVVSIRGRRR